MSPPSQRRSPILALLRLALRDLARRPAAAAVLALGLAVGVSGVLALRVGTEGALASMREMYAEAAGPADLVVLSAGDPGEPLPDGTRAAMESDEEVARTLPLVALFAARLEDAARGGMPFMPSADASLLVLGADDPCPGEPCRWAQEPGGGAGVLVGASWAESRGLRVGDDLNLIDRKGKVITWTIGGTLAREGLGALGYGRVVIAPTAQVRADFGLAPDAAQELHVLLKPGVDPARARERLDKLVEGDVVSLPADRGQDVEQRLGNLRAGTDLLGFAGLFLSAFLIYGQFSARAASQGRALALLRCTGATQAQILWIFLLQALAVALPGAALGALLGVPLARAVAALLALTANADLRLEQVPLGATLVAALLGVVTAVAAALGPAWRASREPAWEGLRARAHAAQPPSRSTVVVALGLAALGALSFWLLPASQASRELSFLRILLLLAGVTAALPGLVAPLAGPLARLLGRLGPAGALGASSLRWRPARSGLSAGAVLVSVALVGGAATLGQGIAVEIDRWTDKALSWDLYVTRVGGFSAEDLADIRATPGVERAGTVTVRPLRVTVSGSGRAMPISAMAVDASVWRSETPVELVPGSPVSAVEAMDALQAPDAALVTSVVAAQLGVGPGDVLLVEGRQGQAKLRVVAEFVDYTQNGYTVLVGSAFATEVLGTTRVDAVAVSVDAGVAPAAVEAALEARTGVLVETRDGLRAQVSALASAVLLSLDLIAWLSGGVGLLSVGAALAQSAFERRRDLAALSALGATRGQRVAIVVVEGVVTAAIGAVGGVVVGAALGKVFADATTTLGIVLVYHPPWKALFGAAAASLVAAVIAAWIPARRVSAVPASEALRAE